MEFGICTNMTAEMPDKTGFEFVEQVKKIGFDYVELPLAEMMALPPDEISRRKAALDALQLPCKVCNNFFPKSFRLTGDSVDFEQVIEYVRRALDRAAALGADTVVFGSGAAKRVPDGFPMTAAHEQLVSLLKRMGPIAESNGITVVLEPLERGECNIVNTFEEACMLAEEVDVVGIMALVDYYHMNCEKESPDVMIENHRWLRHVHMSCPYDPIRGVRVAPGVNDAWDYSMFVSAVEVSGYNGRISIEAYITDFSMEAAQALSRMKALFDGN